MLGQSAKFSIFVAQLSIARPHSFINTTRDISNFGMKIPRFSGNKSYISGKRREIEAYSFEMLSPNRVFFIEPRGHR